MTDLKKPLCYAVMRRGWTHQRGFSVVAITTIKRNVVYCRYVSDNSATHCRLDEIQAKYYTQSDASTAVERALKMSDTLDADIKYARSEVSRLERLQQDAFKGALKYGSVSDKEIEALNNA